VGHDLRGTYTRHQDFFLLFVLVAAFFVMSLMLLRPGGYVLEWWGYYMPHTGFVRLSDQGLYPYIHYWMEYPPLLSWLPVAAYRLSHLLPVWNHPWLWYNVTMGALLLPFELGNLLLVYLISLKVYDRPTALRSAVFYASLFVPLFTWLGWFDCFPLFFLLLALYLILAGRPALAGLATGAGFMTKIIPLLLLPVGWRRFGPLSRRSVTYVALTVLAIVAIALPFLAIRSDLFFASFVNIVTRPSWETVWALLDGYFTGGAVAPLDQRFDPGTAADPGRVSHLPWLWISLAFAGLYLVLYTRRIRWEEGKRVLAFSGLSVILFMLYSKGYSPQFLVYILPFVVLLMPNLKGVAYALLLSAINWLEWPVAQLMLPTHHWLLAAAVLLRTLLLVTLAVEMGYLLFPSLRASPLRRWALRVPLVVALLGLLTSGALAVQGYFADQYRADPYRPVLDFLKQQDGAGVVVSEESLYHRFYPYVGRSTALRLLDRDERSMERLEGLTQKQDRIWIVDIGSEHERDVSTALETWLSERAFPLGSRWFGNARLGGYATGSLPSLGPVQALFAGKIQLTGYALDGRQVEAGQVVRLRLGWKATVKPDADYTVFVHVVGPDGRIWSQRDSQPGGGFRPTTTWVAGEDILDNHALLLGADVPPGEYQLLVGLYEPATGNRLRLADSAGAGGGDALPLATLTVSAGD